MQQFPDRGGADFNKAPAAALVEAVLRHWGYDELPTPFNVHTDSSEFYAAGGAKLGIGSSAAVCTATYAALAELLQIETSVEQAMAVHRQFQGGRGSGLDVAASWHGGVIHFQDGVSRPARWPADMHWRIVWSGASASTAAALDTFKQWQGRAETDALAALCASSTALCDAPFNLSALDDYGRCLRALDQAAGLNIFTPQHERLATIASAHGLVYKPCGAGGGDIGIACGADPAALLAFQDAAAAEQFVPLNLEIAAHGVKASV